MNAKDHLVTLFKKYQELIMEYEVCRMGVRAEIRHFELAGDDYEAERQRLELQRIEDLHALCVGVIKDLEYFAAENAELLK